MLTECAVTGITLIRSFTGGEDKEDTELRMALDNPEFTCLFFSKCQIQAVQCSMEWLLKIFCLYFRENNKMETS